MPSRDVKKAVQKLVEMTASRTTEEIDVLIEELGWDDTPEARKLLTSRSSIGLVEGALQVRPDFEPEDIVALLGPIAKGESTDSIHAAANVSAAIWKALAGAEAIYHRPDYFPPDFEPFTDVMESLSGALKNQQVGALPLVGLWAMFREAEHIYRAANSSYQGAKGANSRHSRQGGRRDKKAELQAIWRSKKYRTKDLCAEKEYVRLNVPFSTARKWLTGA